MSGFGSWARFGVGIVLSLEILRSYFSGGGVSIIAIGLSIVYLALAIVWVFTRH